MTARSPLPLDRLPHARGRIPLLGDLASVDRRHPTQHEVRLAAHLGPIFGRKLLGSRVIVVAGADLAAQACDEDGWARCLAGPGETLRGIVPTGLFTVRSRDPLWGIAHRVLTPGFTQAAMRAYHEAMASVADDLIADWASAPEGRVDMHEAMTAATLEVIARAGFGRRFGLLGGPGPDGDARWFVEALARILRWASDRTNDVPVVGTVRGWWQAGQIRRDVAAARRYVDALIAERRAGHSPAGSDLLALMLDSVDPETGKALPDNCIADQVLTFLVAGHETTAALLEAALHYLAVDPALQQRLRAEVLARGGFGYDQISGLRGIRNLLNETLRLHPPVPGLFRVARTDQELGGYRIPQGQAVFVLSLAAQRDRLVWGPDAEVFDPSRFEAGRRREFPDAFFKPFGSGPRACIGLAFAMYEAQLLLARILTSYFLARPVGVGTRDVSADLRLYERGTLRPEPYVLTATTLIASET